MSDEGVLLARITIERRLHDDDDVVHYRAEDSGGGMPPLIEQLGMLSMAVSCAEHAAAGDDEDES